MLLMLAEVARRMQRWERCLAASGLLSWQLGGWQAEAVPCMFLSGALSAGLPDVCLPAHLQGPLPHAPRDLPNGGLHDG